MVDKKTFFATHPVGMIPCKHCSKPFPLGGNMNYRYCPDCRKLSRYERGKPLEWSPVPVLCEWCKKPIEHNKQAGARRFCTHACRHALERERSKKDLVCITCGKTFRGVTAACCSPACRMKYKGICVTCGAEFVGNKGRMYCSRKCIMPVYTRITANHVCDSCHEPFVGTHAQRNCHREGCASYLFKGNKIGTTYKVEGEITKASACKAVVCSKIDQVIDALFDVYPQFKAEPYLTACKDIKRYFLENRMGDHVHRVAAGAAVFILGTDHGVPLARVMRTINETMHLPVTYMTIRKWRDMMLWDKRVVEVMSLLSRRQIL